MSRGQQDGEEHSELFPRHSEFVPPALTRVPFGFRNEHANQFIIEKPLELLRWR